MTANFTHKKCQLAEEKKENHIVNTLRVGMGFKTLLQGSDQLRMKYVQIN